MRDTTIATFWNPKTFFGSLSTVYLSPSSWPYAEGWHYNNAWFASRGYVVLTYTARGFVSSDQSGNRGSTGETQLDHAAYEVNDYQHLAGQLADDPFFHVNPKKVVTTGGSYGGGFSWLALTDPKWTSPGGRAVKLAASAPKYGHATFPPDIDEGAACLESTDPFESNPPCENTLDELLPEFISFRSAYYQTNFFKALGNGRLKPVPVFSAGTFTDPLFPSHEHRRIVERMKKTVNGYPVQEYYGDYQHFTQNKAKEWGDLCGDDRCSFDDYPGGDLTARPDGLTALGVTTRLNRFVDHYARPPGDPNQPRPKFDVTAALQICPENASDEFPADGPGPRFTAAKFAKLAPNTLRIELSGTQATTNTSSPTPMPRTPIRSPTPRPTAAGARWRPPPQARGSRRTTRRSCPSTSR